MKAKREAEELVDKFMFISDRRIYDAKQCALICVNEKIGLAKILGYKYQDWEEFNKLKEVKQEIEKL